MNNTQELLYFGLDYLIVNIGGYKEQSKAVHFLDSIFSLSHNSTNASTIHNFVWFDSLIDVSLHFGENIRKTDQVVYVHHGRDPIFAIEKISENSPLKTNLK
jgi:hypothetical protein